MDFLKGRYEFCRGKHLLYELRAVLPILQQYWVFPDVLTSLPALEMQTPDLDVPVGIIRKEREEQRSAMPYTCPRIIRHTPNGRSLSASTAGYSREDDYLLTWLRAAKSKGYMLLAPKSSTGNLVGYSFARHPSESVLDRRSILTMLEEVWDSYAVDRGRV